MLIYMSTYDAPDFVVSIYNPSFFADDTASGLTTATASALFLKKSTPDTATALTTFTGGIVADSYAVVTTAGTTNIATNKTSGITNFGSGSGAINIRSTTTGSQVQLGNSHTVCPVYSNGKFYANVIEGVSTDGLYGNGPISIGSLGTTTAVVLGSGTAITSISIGSSATAALTTTIQNPILQQNYTTLPSFASNQNGYRLIKLNNVSGTSSTSVSTVTQLQSFSVDAGVWIFECNMLLPSSIAAFEWYISPTSAILDNTRTCGGCSTTASLTSRMSGVIVNSTTSTWYLNAKSSGVSTAFSAIYLYVTRIG